MATTVSGSTGFSTKISLKRVLIFCGILSSLLYTAANIVVPMQYDGYSAFSQTVSELSAIEAPTRSLWVGFAGVYSLLVAAFGWGIWMSAGEKRSIRVVGMGILISAVVGLFWPPMHQREVLAAGGGSLTDTLHIAFAFFTVLMMLLAMLFGAASFGNRFRVYSIVSVLMMLVTGMLTGIAAPRMEADLPTPWMGVWERISIAAYMLWVIVLAVLLLKRDRVAESNVHRPLVTDDYLKVQVAGKRKMPARNF